MKLTKEQCEFVNRERETLVRMIESKPKLGLFTLHARLEALDIIIQLHNIQIKTERETKEKTDSK